MPAEAGCYVKTWVRRNKPLRVYSSEQRQASEGQRHLLTFPALFTKEVAFPISAPQELYVFLKKPFTSRPSWLCTLLHVIFSPISFLLHRHLKWNICFVDLLLFFTRSYSPLGNPVLLRYSTFKLARPTSRSPVLLGCEAFKLGKAHTFRPCVLCWSYNIFMHLLSC